MSANSSPLSREALRPVTLSTVVGVVVAIAGLYFGRQVLIPFASAVVLAFLLAPAVGFVEKARIGRTPSVLVVLIVSFALLGGAIWNVVSQTTDVISQLPEYRNNIHRKVATLKLPGGLSRATSSVSDLKKELSATSNTAVNSKANGKKSPEPIPVQLAQPPQSAAEYLRDYIGPLAGVVETMILVVILTLFMLVRRGDLRNRLLRLAGIDQLNLMTQAFDDASRRLRRYLLSQFSINALFGSIFGIVLSFIGVPHAMLWGLLAGILRFVPYIGTPIAASFPALLAVAIFPGWTQVGLVLLTFLVLEITTVNVLEPWWYGTHTGVSPLAILIAAIFWGLLWGPVGLILSTPLTVCLLLVGRYVPQLEFLEVLLGDEPVLSPQAHFYQRLLAFDDDEAREIADKFLKENSLESLYDTVLVPALRMAEQDRHTNALDEQRTKFIYDSVNEFVDEYYDAAKAEGPEATADVSEPELSGQISKKPSIVCVPARDRADEIVSVMAAQIMELHGHLVTPVPRGSASDTLEKIRALSADVVCISALPPRAARQARLLCRLMRKEKPSSKFILGLWDFPGGMMKATEKLGGECSDTVVTTLHDALLFVEEQVQASELAEVGMPEHQTAE